VSEPTRRSLFRNLAAGAAVVTCTAPAPAAPVPKPKEPKLPNGFTLQAEWRYCHKCGGMFYAGNETMGTCPAGKEHDGTNSFRYVMRAGLDKSDGVQGGWRRCKKCEGLFYGGEGAKKCPAGDEHDPDAAEYLIAHTTAE
jgi:hypothetical protein